MLHWALIFFITSIIAAFRGNERLSAYSANLAVFIALLFLGLLVVSVVGTSLENRRRGRG